MPHKLIAMTGRMQPACKLHNFVVMPTAWSQINFITTTATTVQHDSNWH